MTDYILPHDLKRKSPALRKGLKLLMDDDLDGALKILASVQLGAPTLAFFKESYGSDWIREHNFDTTLAEQEYGHDWLNRQN